MSKSPFEKAQWLKDYDDDPKAERNEAVRISVGKAGTVYYLYIKKIR
jgi:hypothetical protein